MAAIRAGALRYVVKVHKLEGGDGGSLGDYVAGAWRFANIEAAKSGDDVDADFETGLDVSDITVRACDETRGWDSGNLLEETAGPSGLKRVFDIEGPGQPDRSGAYLIFKCTAGKSSLKKAGE